MAVSALLKKSLPLSLVVVIALFSAGAGFFASQWHTEQEIDDFLETYPHLDPARSIIEQEHFITTLEPLRKELNAMADTFGRENVSLYVEYLNTGANISINPDLYLWPASLAKIPLALAVMRKVEEGTWKLTNELVLMEGDRNSESSDAEEQLSEYPIGTRFTIERLLEEMLVYSDNTAFYILLRNMHADEMSAVVEDIGLEELFTEDGKVSAKEYSRLFRALYTSSFLSREHSEYLLELLERSPFEDFLASAVPDDIPFPHKYGEKITENVYADSGIVYVPHRPYMITVIVQLDEAVPFEEARPRAIAFMQEISRVVFEYMTP